MQTKPRIRQRIAGRRRGLLLGLAVWIRIPFVYAGEITFCLSNPAGRELIVTDRLAELEETGGQSVSVDPSDGGGKQVFDFGQFGTGFFHVPVPEGGDGRL